MFEELKRGRCVNSKYWYSVQLKHQIEYLKIFQQTKILVKVIFLVIHNLPIITADDHVDHNDDVTEDDDDVLSSDNHENH